MAEPAPADGPENRSADGLQDLRDQVGRLMDEGDDRAALPLLDAIIRAAPDDGAAYNDRGLARWRSIDVHDRADEGFAALQNRLCLEVQSDCDKVRLALADLDRSIALQSGAPRAVPYVNRAEIRFARGDIRQALADADEALRLRPADARTHRRRAEMRLVLGDRTGALADLDAALNLVDDTATLARRAELRKTMGDVDGARADVDQALRRPAPPWQNPRAWSHTLHSLRRAVARPGEPGMEPELGLTVLHADLRPGRQGSSMIDVTLKPEDAARFSAFTEAHVGSTTDVSLDGRSLMQPIILQPITGGAIQISGSMSDAENAAIVARLRGGAQIKVRALD